MSLRRNIRLKAGWELLKLAWDLIGSEFAGRHQQYEKFYGGRSVINKLLAYRNYDFVAAKRFAEAALVE